MTNKQIIRALNSRKKELEATRDKLRDLESIVADIADVNERAIEALAESIDALSEVV